MKVLFGLIAFCGLYTVSYGQEYAPPVVVPPPIYQQPQSQYSNQFQPQLPSEWQRFGYREEFVNRQEHIVRPIQQHEYQQYGQPGYSQQPYYNQQQGQQWFQPYYYQNRWVVPQCPQGYQWVYPCQR